MNNSEGEGFFLPQQHVCGGNKVNCYLHRYGCLGQEWEFVYGRGTVWGKGWKIHSLMDEDGEFDWMRLVPGLIETDGCDMVFEGY